MNFDTLFNTYLNGDPFHDTIVIGILFTVMFEFYKICFSAMFSFFKK
jgi:hypothetical protein